MLLHIASHDEPAGTWPGQRTTVGVRMPPSSVDTFVAAQRRVVGPGGSAVVGSEHHERVVLQARAIDGVEHLADAPIDFFDPIVVNAVRRFVFELRAGIKRPVNRVVRQVEEERPVVLLRNELHRFVRIAGRHRFLSLGTDALDELLVAQHRKRRMARASFVFEPFVGRRRSSDFGSAIPARAPSLRGPMSFEYGMPK